MKLKLLLFGLFFSVLSWGQILIPDTTPIVQNFDAMNTIATASLPANWKMSVAGAGTPKWTDGGNFTAVAQQASTGTPATGARYNWGNVATTDRALGIMTSSSFASPNSIMSYFKNTNIGNLSQLTISYNLERYRINTADASVQFYYSLDGITWNAVTAGDVAAASLPPAESAYSFTPGLTVIVGAFNITGLSIPTNEDIYLRWNLNTTGTNSQGIGIDDVSVTASFTAVCTPPANPAGAITATPSCGATSLAYSLPSATSYWQTTATGTSTANPTTSPLVVATNGTYYVRDFVSSCWSTGNVSQAVTITNAINITTQPANQAPTVGNTATFSVAATNAVSYQWQVSTNGGGTWTNVGTNTNSFTTAAATLAMSGNQYRVLINANAPCANVTSSVGTLTVVVPGGTVFNPGELVFVGYDGQINSTGQNDEYLIATLVDMIPGTSFSLVNSRYEAGAAANVRTNKWGGGGDNASLQPYEVKLTYNGATVIPAGSVLRFETNNGPFWFGTVDVITGTTSTTRTSEFSGTLISGNPNISTGGSDQMYLMQGAFTFDGTTTANEANYYLSGTLLHGLTNRAAWVPLSNACNGGSTGGNTRESRLPSALTCFNVENASTSSNSAFYENDKQHGLATIRQIVLGISDVANNWTLSSGRYTIDPLSSLTTRAGKTFLIGPSNPAGQWVGNVDTNWFNCANWEGLAVPNATTNVTISTTSEGNAEVNYLALYSDLYSDIAVCNDIVISDKKLIVEGNVNNVINVYGNLTISASGVVDMDDSNPANADGTLHLFGNWTNDAGNDAFQEGNGTVHFDGTVPQIINNVTPAGTEVFYNVVMNNNFDTAVSNDLIAAGNLIINAGRTLNIDGNGYVRVNDKLTHNGDLIIQNNGQFIQVNETDSNDGVYSGTKFQVIRTASVRNLDYVYWGSPVENFAVSNLPNSHRYYWNTLAANANGTQGTWSNASGNMTNGLGYIARASNGATTNQAMNLVFSGKPNNGIITLPIVRGNYDGVDYDAEPSNPSNIFTTKYDDNWSLVGNPYPSAIDAEEFLVANQTKIEGSVWIWTHGTLPSSLTDPFYDNYVYNYTANDFIKYNGLGATEPDTFAGKIASGQGFMINMLHTTSTPNTIEFNNSFRTGAALANYNNSDFYRTATSSNSFEDQEKHRMWLDVVNTTNGQSDRTLLGYATNATNARDHFYDCFHKPNNAVSFYSLIDGAPFIIQGRSLPFDVNDKVSMGFCVGTTSAVTIAIRKVDGIFSEGQTIYLEDKALSTIHNLSANPYSFTSNAGIFTDRFVIRYTNETLSNPDFIEDANAVFISSKEGITVTSKIENIQEIEVYDLLGRKLYQNKNVDSQTHLIQSIQKNNSGLIFTITLENGKKVIKKTIY